MSGLLRSNSWDATTQHTSHDDDDQPGCPEFDEDSDFFSAETIAYFESLATAGSSGHPDASTTRRQLDPAASNTTHDYASKPPLPPLPPPPPVPDVMNGGGPAVELATAAAGAANAGPGCVWDQVVQSSIEHLQQAAQQHPVYEECDASDDDEDYSEESVSAEGCSSAPDQGMATQQNGETSASALTAHGTQQALQYRDEWQLVQGVFDLIKQQLSPMALANTEKILNFLHPKQLRTQIDFGLSDQSNESWQDVLHKCEQIVQYSAKTGHRFFLQQLYHGVDPYGFAAAMLIEGLNTSIYTYDVGPVITLIENEVVAELVKLLGWPHGDGIFCPGGSMANFYAMNVARYTAEPGVKQTGMQHAFGGKTPVIFASDETHYSVTKGTGFMGMGTNAVYKVPTDELGAMRPDKLEQAIRQVQQSSDRVPLMVFSTAGTTVLNAYDPLDTIADICAKHNIWMHTDMCLGGASLFSDSHRSLLKGIERSDSASWCWHKVLCAPFQTSLFLCRRKGQLKAAHQEGSSYLFASDKHYDPTFDTGDASLQCGRRPDALKVWLMWKARGRAGIGANVDAAFKSTDYFFEQITARPDHFRMVIPKAQGTSVCFWVIPPSLRGRTDVESEDYKQTLNDLQQKIKGRLVMRGHGMIACQPIAHRGLPNFYRCTFGCHPVTTEQDIDEWIETLVSLSQDL